MLSTSRQTVYWQAKDLSLQLQLHHPQWVNAAEHVGQHILLFFSWNIISVELNSYSHVTHRVNTVVSLLCLYVGIDLGIEEYVKHIMQSIWYNRTDQKIWKPIIESTCNQFPPLLSVVMDSTTASADTAGSTWSLSSSTLIPYQEQSYRECTWWRKWVCQGHVPINAHTVPRAFVWRMRLAKEMGPSGTKQEVKQVSQFAHLELWIIH